MSTAERDSIMRVLSSMLDNRKLLSFVSISEEPEVLSDMILSNISFCFLKKITHLQGL